MRRPRSVGEAQGWRTVDRLARKFEYPDERTFPTAPAFGGGGGEFTISVAASDATAEERDKADIQAAGHDDQDAVNAAAQRIHANNINEGGQIVLSRGHFRLNGLADVGENVTLQGMSLVGTVVTRPSGTIVRIGNQSQVRDLALLRESGGSVGTLLDVDGSHCRVDNVWFERGALAVDAHDGLMVTRCESALCPVFVDGGGQWPRVVVANNGTLTGVGRIVGVWNEWRVSGNRLEGNVVTDPTFGEAYGTQITDNVWVNDLFVSGPLIDAQSQNGLIVARNTTRFFYTFINLDAVRSSLIVDNVGIEIESGVVGSDVFDSIVAANMFGGEGGFVGRHGIILDGNGNHVNGNTIVAPGIVTDDTFDGVNITGDENVVIGNKVSPSTFGNASRSGVNIAGGDDNAAYANYLGDASAYGTAEFDDGGTGTMTAPGANGQFSV